MDPSNSFDPDKNSLNNSQKELFFQPRAGYQGRLPGVMTRFNNRNTLGTNSKFGPILSAFLFGVGSALLMSPCTTPILGGVLALISSSETFAHGAALMTIYAVGFSLLFILMGAGLLSLKSIPKSGQWLTRLHKVGTIALIAFGLYYIADAARKGDWLSHI